MNKTLRITMLAISVFGLSASAFAQKTRKVLIIGIDGCVNSVFSQTNSPNIQNLINTGYYASNTLNQDPTLSGPNWATILTGTKVSKHGVTSNNWGPSNLATYKSFFNAIKTQYPAKRTAAIVTYGDLNRGVPVALANQIISDNDLTLKQNGTDVSGEIYGQTGFSDPEADVDTKNKVVAELTNNNPDAIFCHFDTMDGTGHSTGFGPSNPAYVSAIGIIDGHIGAMLAAINARPTIANEDWLVVVTTDHGGIGTGHGGTSYVERNSFIILKGAGITQTLVNDAPVDMNNNFSASAVGFTSNVYGELPALPTLDLSATGNFTIEFRVRRTGAVTNTLGTDADPVIIANKDWDSGLAQGFLAFERGGKLGVVISDGTNRTNVYGTNTVPIVDLTDAKWHYISVVVNRTANNISIYDNGILAVVNTITAGTGSLSSGKTFKINQDGDGNYGAWFNGNVSDVRIYNQAVPQSAILSNIGNDNLSTATTGLIYYAKGHDGSGTKYTGSLGGDVTLKGSVAPTWSTASAGIEKESNNVAPLYNTVNATIPSPSVGLDLSATGSFTIELAVKRAGAVTTGATDPVILGNKSWASGANSGLIISDNGGTIKVNVGDGTNRADVNGASLTDVLWHYLTVVVNRTTQKLSVYDGGVLQNEASISNVTGTMLNANNFRIAQDGTGVYSSTFNGSVKALRFFNTALDANTVKTFAFADNIDNAHPNYANLRYFLKAREGSGTILVPTVDVTTIGNTTISAAPTWGANTSTTAAYTVQNINYGNAPYTYSIAPTVLKWLNVPIPASYDGVVLAGITTLPVTLTSFTGVANNNSVSLKWNVSSEVNVDKYDVERSASKDNFVKVGELKATGATSYATTDYTPLNGVNYYRLKVTDKDGTVEYKNTIAVNFGLTSGKSGLVAPNPITGSEIGVQLKQYPAGKYNYSISNTLGSIVQQGSFNYNGYDKISIELKQALTKGIYLLNINSGKEKFQSKLVAQ